MSQCHDIAAQLLTGARVWGEALHSDLYDTLTEADKMVSRAGGRLTSRQAISAIIVAWQMQHPYEDPYERS